MHIQANKENLEKLDAAIVSMEIAAEQQVKAVEEDERNRREVDEKNEGIVKHWIKNQGDGSHASPGAALESFKQEYPKLDAYLGNGSAEEFNRIIHGYDGEEFWRLPQLYVRCAESSIDPINFKHLEEMVLQTKAEINQAIKIQQKKGIDIFIEIQSMILLYFPDGGE